MRSLRRNRKQNLIDILRDNPDSLSLTQIESIFNDFNFELQKKTKGSHRKYRRGNITIIIFPHNGKTKETLKNQKVNKKH